MDHVWNNLNNNPFMQIITREIPVEVEKVSYLVHAHTIV
jgi:hypothetical protein